MHSTSVTEMFSKKLTNEMNPKRKQKAEALVVARTSTDNCPVIRLSNCDPNYDPNLAFQMPSTGKLIQVDTAVVNVRRNVLDHQIQFGTFLPPVTEVSNRFFFCIFKSFRGKTFRHRFRRNHLAVS